ncbi:hypothetical protein [Planktotalea sp.]|uniref:hypothetical protein n=1 Tax=Planktotalea sp. TaxID=2029877 RepID=UPI003D6B59D3
MTQGQVQFEVRRFKNAYYVFRNEVPVLGPENLDQAEEALERLKREENSQERSCMTCDTAFLSEGPHNRLCTACRARSFYDGAA